MTEAEHVTVKMHRAQAEFADCQALLSGFVGGRGSGKSWAGAYRLLRHARIGGKYMVVAPSYKVLSDCTMESFWQVDRGDEAAGQPGLHRVRSFSKTDRVAHLQNGATIAFRSGDDPNSLRGPNLWGCWLDEASYMHRDVYTVCIGSLRAGGRVGHLWATFTPNGLSHWTFDVFGPGCKTGAALFNSHTGANPFNPPEFVERLKLLYTPLRFLQEGAGLFVTIEGAEWPPDYLPESMFYKELPQGVVMRFWVHSLDPSMGKDAKQGDLSALLRVGLSEDMHIWVDDAWMDVKPCDQVEDMSVAFLRGRECGGFIVESNNFQERVAANIKRKHTTDCTSLAIPMYTHVSSENKEVRIRMALTPLLSQGRVHLKDTPANRAGFAQMQEFPLPKCHDDYPDSLTLATVMINTLLGGKQSSPLRLVAK